MKETLSRQFTEKNIDFKCIDRVFVFEPLSTFVILDNGIKTLQ